MSVKSKVQSAVDKAMKSWAQTEEAAGMTSENNENVLDGRYEAKLVSFKLDEFAGKPIARLSFEIDGAICKEKDPEIDAKEAAIGEIVHNRYGLDNPKGQSFLKRDLRTKFDFGADDINAISGQEELAAMLSEIESGGLRFQITTRTNADGWQNVFMGAELEGTGEAEDEALDLEAMSLKELKELAKEEECDLGKSKTKAPIVKKLTAHFAAAEEEEEEEAGAEEEEEEEEEADAEADAEEEEEEEDELEVGSKVVCTWKGDEVEGIVREITEDELKCKVYVPSIKKKVTVKVEGVELIA